MSQPERIESAPNALRRRRLLTSASVAALIMAAGVQPALAGGPPGYWSPGQAAPAAAAAAAQAGAQQAAAAAQQTQITVSRVTQSIRAIQDAQAAARAAALAAPTTVPNGLVPNGLQVAPNAATDPSLWKGANLPTSFADGDRTKVTVEQTSSLALLTWQTFNVGKQTDLYFNQTAGGASANGWIALNRVLDPNAAPSQILGTIRAEGQVYVINQNGIIFGGSSQVNVGTLIASALPINDSLVKAGTLYSNPDSRFTFSAYAQPGGTVGPTDPFAPPAATAQSQSSAVVVEAGAQISTLPSSAHSGGRVILIGPEVVNAGSITTPDGQTILAAGQQVALLPHVSTDPSLRGLDVFVGSIVAPQIGSNAVAGSIVTGSVTNSGVVEADRGNITLAGADIKQAGALLSTTSVALNGRIDIQASYNNVAVPNSADATTGVFSASATGLARFSTGSVTEILPELGSSETAVGGSLALNSIVNVSALAAYIDGAIVAPGGNVTIGAGRWSSATRAAFQYTDGQIYLDSHALIDVSGSIGIVAPAASAIVAAELRGAQLADSPLQRAGILAGQTVYIDINDTGTRADGTTWIGTPVADASGAIGLVKHTVGELTTAGGSITLTAGKSIVSKAGSLFNVSGGYVEYQGGTVQTTRLVANGRLYDIADADPNIVYDGIYSGFADKHEKWGVTANYTNPLLTGVRYQNGYLQGGAGGSLSLNAPAAVLEGQMLGATIAGEKQREKAPTGSSLALKFVSTPATSTTGELTTPAATPNVIIGAVTPQAIAPFTVGSYGLGGVNDVYLSAELAGPSGFAAISVGSGNGTIEVRAPVTMAAGGALSLTGANVRIFADIVAAGGTVSAATVDLDPSVLLPLGTLAGASQVQGRGELLVAGGVTISTAGAVVDDRADPLLAVSPYRISGGSIALTGYYTRLTAGSVIDASGGVRIAASGKQSFGKAGSIAISGGLDGSIDPNVKGTLQLDAALKGYGVGAAPVGGSLSIGAPAIAINTASAISNALNLGSTFFDQGGFRAFSLSGIKVDVAGAIAPSVASYAVDQGQGVGKTVLTPTLLPALSRSPASIGLAAVGFQSPAGGAPLIRGDLVIDDGASIRAAPTVQGTGAIAISGDNVTVRGSLVAAGGSITISGSADAISGAKSVYLASGSLVSAAGAYLATLDSLENIVGKVLAGGTVSISGNILAEANATIDVSGTSATVQVASLNALGRPVYTPTVRQTDGGAITLTGKQNLYTAATLIGRSGGASALGGTLSVSSGKFLNDGTPNLLVTQHATGGDPLADAGHFAVDDFLAGGFDSLALGGRVRFSGSVAIQAAGRLSVANGGVLVADADVTLTAPYVSLGVLYAAPQGDQTILAPTIKVTSGASETSIPVAPTFGTGALTVNASDLIDLGGLVLQNIGSANLTSTNDIRGDGTFEVRGALTMTAGQIYPIAATTFTIAAFDYGTTGRGSITLLSSGVERGLPMSAGGQLNVFASSIVQDGVLRAPIGIINLGSSTPQTAVDGNGAVAQTFNTTQSLTLGGHSVTSVSAIDPITGKAAVLPYGTMLNGTSWIDPAGNDITSGGVIAKTVNLAGSNIDIGAGAVVDLRGGGDLYAYNWVKGLGGNTDILGSSSSYAIVPTYRADYAPVMQVTRQNADGTSSIESGWSNNSLKVGDQITLTAATNGLPAGTYTLLPAGYALLPGAYLVTPLKTATAANTVSVANPDGSSVVSGYVYNGLNSSRSVAGVPSLFEVAPNSVVQARAQYDGYSANSALAKATDAALVRLPIDSGQLAINAISSLVLNGTARMQAPSGGLGGIVSITSASNIVINNSGSGATANTLYLRATDLTDFGADSLLIGGVATGNVIRATAGALELANDSANALRGSDIILLSTGSLVVGEGSVLEADGNKPETPRNFVIGLSTVPGSADGAAIRVSADQNAQLSRNAAAVSLEGGSANLVVHAGARISGGTAGSIVLDSTKATAFDQTASLSGASVTLASGQISVLLDNPGALQANAGLILPQAVVADLQTRTNALSLLSYTSLDIYGTGSIGGVDATGRPEIASLSLHAATIRGFNQGSGAAIFNARSVVLDNKAGGTAVAAVSGVNSTPSGTLLFNSDTIQIGSNALNIVGYETVSLNAPKGILLQGTGELSTAGNLTVSTVALTASDGAVHGLKAANRLVLQATGTETAFSGGIGAAVTLSGASIANNTQIRLPSGTLTLHATGADPTSNVELEPAGVLDVGGSRQSFFDVTKYTSAGQVNLISDNGSVLLDAGSTVNVAALGVGNAGTLSIAATHGNIDVRGQLRGQAGNSGTGGNFIADASRIVDPTGQAHLAALDNLLDAGGFTQSRAFRVREGDVVVDGAATARQFLLAVDSGAIGVTGKIDASGQTGGAIALYAYNGITVSGTARLSVAAERLDSAGKGGSVTLETGEAKAVGGVMTPGTGWIDVQGGSVIDLSVAGGPGGTLHLRAPQISGVDGAGAPIPTNVNSVAGGTDLAIRPLAGTIRNPSSIVVEGFQVFDLADSGGVITSTVQANADLNGRNFTSHSAAISDRLLAATPNAALTSRVHVQPGEEMAAQGAATLTLNSAGSTISLPAGAGITFPSGTPSGDTVMFSVGGTITSASGVVTAFAANTPLTIAAGATVALERAGNVTLASGTTPVAVALKGSGSVTSGTGASTSLTATASGVSLTLNGSGSSVSLPANTAIVFPAGIPSGDSLKTSVPVTFTTTGAGATVVLDGVGSTLSVTSVSTPVSFFLPVGDTISSSGAFTTISSGGGVLLTAGKTITLPANANVGLSLATGAVVTNNISGAVITTPAAGSRITLNNASFSSVKVADNTTVLTFPSGTPGTDRIRSSVAATITDANGVVTAVAANTTFTMPAGGSLTLTGSSSGGTVTFASGSTQIPVTLSAGTFSLSTNISIVSVTGGSMLSTGTATGTLALGSTSADVALSLSAGRYTTNGSITALPVGSSISSGTVTLTGGSKPLAISLPQGTFTSGAGNAINSLPSGSTISASSLGVLTVSGGDVAIPLSLLAGTYSISGAASLGLTSDITLGSDWNLNAYRYGPNVTAVLGSGEPGNLRLRASGNLIFNGALSDGFGASPTDPNTLTPALWEAPLLAPGSRSWSYQLAAGADLVSSDFHQVTPSNGVSGFFKLGKTGPGVTSSISAATSSLLKTYYQVIRTGTGNIDIVASADVQLLNQFATIYTAGSQLLPDLVQGDTTYAFDLPRTAFAVTSTLGSSIGPAYAPQYSSSGGNVSIRAGRDIVHLTGGDADDSSQQLPTNWLYRRDSAVNGVFAKTYNGDYGSTSWWIDFSNFFEGVGALGGGNVTLSAGRDVKNVDAVVPTNAWTPYKTTVTSGAGQTVDVAAANQPLFEFGGGDLTVRAGRDINAGVYYVERGNGELAAGRNVTTNATRSAIATATQASGYSNIETVWLPTTLFLGKGNFDVSALGQVTIGTVANPFLLPMGENNGYWNRTYFSTFAASDSVSVSSLTGDITVKPNSLDDWISNVLSYADLATDATVSKTRPWLRLTDQFRSYVSVVNADGSVSAPIAPTAVLLGTQFSALTSLMPPTLRLTAFQGDVNIVGKITLTPAATGTAEVLAGGSILGLQPYAVNRASNLLVYGSATINVSDADPNSVPDSTRPILPPFNPNGSAAYLNSYARIVAGNAVDFSAFNALFAETGATTGAAAKGSVKQALHTKGLLHDNDPEPVRLYSRQGDISDLMLFAAKKSQVFAARDISDVALYIQNNRASDISIVAAGRDITLYDPLNAARSNVIDIVQNSHTLVPLSSLLGNALAGDISIGGPGTLQVLAGRDLDLGVGNANRDGTAVGIVSIGNGRNPYLPFNDGANIIAAAGIGPIAGTGLSGGKLGIAAFTAHFLDPATAGDNAAAYLPELGTLMGLKGASNADVWAAFDALDAGLKAKYVSDVFYLVLRDAGRDHNAGNLRGGYALGYQAIEDLFPGSTWSGDITLTSREIKTSSGGNISVLLPGGQLFVGIDAGGKQPLDQGLLTLSGGDISIFARQSVTLGTSRIFTFKGGDVTIWSTDGNIAAGAASKTLQSAPPARYLVDPETGASILDLAGLATGGGIGVLQTVPGAPIGNVDLVAPNGVVDAGDAGIRVSGSFNVAAVQVLNASNIQVGGSSTGVPIVSAPNIGGLTAAGNAAGAASKVAETPQAAPNNTGQPSIIIAEVIGYGGGTPDTDAGDSDEKRRRRDGQ